MQTIPNYEKLGLFYLGKKVDPKSSKLLDDLLLYKNKNLTTHAAIIGMTGSGKTGLGIGMIEEAAIDNIPSLIIDPKGDMGNLLLAFEDLNPKSFEPWIDPKEAEQKGMDVPSYAKKTADMWSSGIESWHQDKNRIKKFKNGTDFTIYTPGSSAGVMLSVLSSFDAPPQEVLEDSDTFSAMLNATISSLLALIDVDADPLQSREYLLISSIFSHFWKQGVSLNLEELIGYITNPPFKKVGVLTLKSFYPQNDRLKLAMLLNNVLASPSFANWTKGEPLDIQNLLYTDNAKARVTILSIAHLNDKERMFFVTLLLNKFIAWMRKQKGTSSLKALLYMDEIFGFFPATSKPPSKEPMLLLLKQARAFGVGVVLSTQNPIDIDYKGLSNIGSWFIGRLQTKQDRDRVIDGLIQNDTSVFDKKTIEKMLSNLKSRRFLFKSNKSDTLKLFETRWVLSYLRGPISKQEISKLMESKKRESKANFVESVSKTHSLSGDISKTPPLLSENIDCYYFNQAKYGEKAEFEPYLSLSGTYAFVDNRRGVDKESDISLQIYLDKEFNSPDWDEAEINEDDKNEYDKKAPIKSLFYELPHSIAEARSLRDFEKDFSNYLYRTKRLELFRNDELELESKEGENIQSFKIQMEDAIREAKEEAIESLKAKFTTKAGRLEDKYRRALEILEKEEADVSAKKTDTILSFGLTILDAFMGKKTMKRSTTSRAASSIKKAGGLYREKGDVKRAQEKIATIEQKMQVLNTKLEDNIDELIDGFDIDNYEIETFSIKPRRSDIYNIESAIVWKAR